ncbi:MAG TPA: alpha-amylase/4-alpha-glucanotransferase domain-containing protein [Gemmatimonadaceae bacterium]|nr:alpha-amylase/4-alpha-glucanotransferase domain-containing protein [Gemmatimonadaceae bacterium]
MNDRGDRPLRFCFGLHLHQPVGNFGHVFEQHVRDVYLPFLQRLEQRAFFPVALHVSGPLIEWLEANDTRYLDLLGRLASDGRVELLLAGFYEPVLACLPHEDRHEQIAWMRETLRRRFGVEASGLWLTERVWEPDLAEDLHDAGVEFALVDDRHFVVTGFHRPHLHVPYRTEHAGKRIALFPIDERLRYLVPFQPPEETADYLRQLRRQGHRLAILADDGEKFGGWPGTKEWVFDKGWLDRFISVMSECMNHGEVVLSRFDEALRETPSGGLAYLSTASYREMEMWSLPAEGALSLMKLERELGEARLRSEEAGLVRGSHWRNFLVKYPEANRMHKKMLALSALCRARGNPEAARRAIGRAQCNDAYWHGVFGGLYLPFLRSAIWEQLALAEESLRKGESLTCETVDVDCDGNDELWIHSGAYSAIVSPHRGGAVEELTRFATRENLANTLTRRREAYHVTAHEEALAASKWRAERHGRSERSAPSIHDLEHGITLETLPPEDRDTRALFLERVLPAGVTREQYESVEYEPIASATRIAMQAEVNADARLVEITLRSADGRLVKRLTFGEDGTVRAHFTWNRAAFPADSWFTTEISIGRAHALNVSDEAEVWHHPIETVAKSERGLEQTLQGTSYLVRWPVARGTGEVTIPAVEP